MSCRPKLLIDGERLLVRVAYAGPSDSKRCPTHDSLSGLHHVTPPAGLGELQRLQVEGDQLLSFTRRRPDLDRQDLQVTVQAWGLVGAVWHSSGRKLVASRSSGLVFCPTPVEGYLDSTLEVLEGLRSYLEAQAFPCAVQWALGSGREENDPDDLARDLGLPARVPVFRTGRRTGEGTQAALESVVARALAAFDAGAYDEAE